MRKFIILILFLTIISANEIYDKQKDFNLIYGGASVAFVGDIDMTGAPIMCAQNNNGQCNWNYDGYLFNANGKFLNVESFNLNSSSSVINIPENVTIKWVGLFWQGHIWKIDRRRYHPTVTEYNDLINGYNSVKIKINDSPVKNIIVNENKCGSYGFIDNNKYSRNNGARFFYECYYDENTSSNSKIIQYLHSGNNKIVVGNIKSTPGEDQYIGDPLVNWGSIKYGPWGGWTLVIVYKYNGESSNSYKTFSVYNGFKKLIPELYNGSEKCININLKNFYTPRNGNVNSNMLFFAAGGEKKMHWDSLQLKNKNGDFIDVSNNDNPSDDQFNDTISKFGNDINSTRIYNPGIDSDMFEVGVNGSGNEIIGNEQTQTTIKLCAKANNQMGDQSFPSLIAFSTQLYVPKVCYYDFNLYNENGNLITSDTKLYVGDKIKVHYKIKNDENESAKNVYIIYPYNENNLTEYISNSTKVKNVLEDNFTNIEDNTTIDNLGVYVDSNALKIGILGDSNNEFKPYYVNNNYVAGIEFNVTLKKEGNLSFIFYADYNYSLGDKIYSYQGILPKCSEFNQNYQIYQPKIKQFNVVHYQPDITYDPIDVNDSINALYTQIVNKEFNVTVVKLADDNETLESYLGFVKLDLINAPQNEEECKTLPSVIPYRYIMFLNQSKVHVHNIIVPNAYRDLRFRITYVKNDSDSCMNALMNFIENPFSNWANAFSNCASCGSTCVQSMMGCTDIDNCQEGVNTCLDCIFGHSEVDTVCSRDDFAIRPYAFLVFGNNQYKRAGEDFNVTIKAVDENNYNLVTGILSDISGVGGYDVNLSDLNISAIFYSPTADEVKQMNQDVYGINDANASRVAYCPDVGIFNIVGNNIHFINGEVNATLNYSESGILSLKVSEINGSEFAKVDEKDTPDSQRLIKAATTIINKNDISQRDLLLEFIPYKFVTEGEYNTTTNGFVYMDEINNSFTPDMAAFLRYKIIAKNKNDEPLKNFTKTCFPDTSVSAPSRNGLKLNTTFDLFLDADVNISDNINLSFSNIDLKDNTHIWLLHPKYNLTKGFHHIQEWISPLNFVEGEGEVKLFFNIDKDFRHPRGEVNITVNDINTSTSWMSNPGATKIFEGTDLNNTAIFRYGRIRVENISGYGNEINTTFKYQYWDNDKGWVVNKDHISSVFGDINNSSSYLQFVLNNFKVNMNVNSPIQNGEKNVTFTTSHALPYSAKIHLSIPSWLWYHPLAQKYKNPSATNLNCLTHPCFKVNFKKESSGWGGIGTQSQKYKETNRTSEINASLKKINVNKKTVKKINW